MKHPNLQPVELEFVKNGNLQPVKFEMSNMTMVGPGCGDLPVFKGEGRFISCWELTDEQIREITETRRIWLSIHGAGQPPVSLTVEYPFTTDDVWPEEIPAVEEK